MERVTLHYDGWQVAIVVGVGAIYVTLCEKCRLEPRVIELEKFVPKIGPAQLWPKEGYIYALHYASDNGGEFLGAVLLG